MLTLRARPQLEVSPTRWRRHREFVVFNGEYVYPEYVIAYQRFNNGHGPVG